MANPNEFNQPVSFLNGGPFETTWGPYATKELACLALKNEVDADGKNMRMGKKVAIGTMTNYVEHVWEGSFEDIDLVRYLPDSNSYSPVNNLSILNGKTGFTLDPQKRLYTVASGTTSVNATYLRPDFQNIISVINEAISRGIYAFRIYLQFTSNSPLGHQINLVSNQRNTNISLQNSITGRRISQNINFQIGEALSSLSLLSRFSIDTAPEDLYAYLEYVNFQAIGVEAINARFKDIYEGELIGAYPINNYSAANDLSIITPNPGISLDITKRLYHVATGTTSINSSFLRSGLDSVLSVINNAIASNVLSFILEYEFTSTIGLTHQFNVSSDKRNTNITLSSTSTGVKKRYIIDFLPGEILKSFGLVSRFPITTTAQDLTAIVIGVTIRHATDAMVNQQLSDAYITDIANKAIGSPKGFKNVLISLAEYDALAKYETFGEKIYRGLKLVAGTNVNNTCFVGYKLGENQSYLDGQTIIIEATFKCNVNPMLHFNASLTSIGNNLYVWRKEISSFGSNDAAKIFNYFQGKTSTTAVDVIITLEKLEIAPTNQVIYSAAIDKLASAKGKNPKIRFGKTMGTYGEVYTNFVTPANSLTDGSPEMGYDIIEVAATPSTYDLTAPLDYNNIQDQTPFKRGPELPPYVNLYMIEGSTLTMFYDVNDPRMDQQKFQAISGLNFMGANKLKNVRLIVRNCRYAVHDDGNVYKGSPFFDNYVDMENVYFEHLGNDPSISWTGTGAYISGHPSGKTTRVRRSTFIGKRAFSVHESPTMLKPLDIQIDDSFLLTNAPEANDGLSLALEGAWTNATENKVSLNNTNCNGRIRISNNSASKTWKLNGGGNNIVPSVSIGIGLGAGKYYYPEFSNEVYYGLNRSGATIARFKPVKVKSSIISLFNSGDVIADFYGIALDDIPNNTLGAIRYAGYIDSSLIGLTAVLGDYLCVDAGVFVKNGVNKIAFCDYVGVSVKDGPVIGHFRLLTK